MSTKDYFEKDYYKALGVAKDADAKAIKKAYRTLAQELHPDKNPGDAKAEARFKEVSEAYDVLSDQAKRQEYDEIQSQVGSFPGGFGGGGFGGSGTRGYPGGAGYGGGASTFDMSDLFGGGGNADMSDLLGNLFGGGRGSARSYTPGPRRGQDVSADISLDFDEAVRGGTMPLTLSSPGTCGTCRGSGARPGTAPHTCPVCDGSGFVSRNSGAFGMSEPCRNCGGSGQVVDDPCPTCHGSGSVTQRRTITVRFPAGVRDGARLRIPGKGTPGQHNGPAGDLYVTVHVAGDTLFGRSGDDLTITVPVSFAEAALGTTVRVPTLDGAVSVKVAAGTPSGRKLRVRGRGVHTKKHTGDLIVTVEVAVPARLSAEARAAVEALAAADTDDPRPEITAALRHREGSAT